MPAPAQSYSIIFDAFVESAAATIDMGYGGTKNAAGTGYVVASTANLATSSTGTFDGAVLETASPGKTFQLQRDAIVEARCVPFVGPGIIEDAVLASDGKIRRSSAVAGIVIGTCDKEGNVHLTPSGGVLNTLAGDVTGNPLANTVEKIRNASVPALSGNGGKALVLNALATAFTFVAVATSGYDTLDHSGGGQEVLSATGSSGLFTVRDGVSQQFGTSGVPTTGLARFPKTDTSYSLATVRNHGNSADINALGIVWSGSLDVLAVGDTTVLGAQLLLQSNAFIMATVSGTSLIPFTATSEYLHVGSEELNGLPVKFGTNPATTGGGLRFTSYSSLTTVIGVRGGANTTNRNLLATGWDGARDNVTIGQAEIDAVVSGANAFVGMLGAVADSTILLSKSDFTAPTVQFGVVGVGSGAISMTTGAGAPSASANNGSFYWRNNAADATQFLYGRIGGAWVSIGGGSSGVTWATDLATSTDTSQIVSQITGTAGACSVISGTVLKFLGATTVASTGTLRFIKNQTIIAARNNGDSANLTVLATTSGDMIQVGGNGALGVSATGFFEIGTNVATVGAGRYSNNVFVAVARNFLNNGDIALVKTDASNNTLFGDTARVGYYQGSTVIFQGSSAELARADTSGILCPNNVRLGTITYTGLWFGQGSPSTSNYAIYGSSGSTHLNVTTSSTGYFREADSARAGWSALGLFVTDGRNLSVGNESPTMNSATNTIFCKDGTQPSTNPTAGWYQSADGGRWHIRSSYSAEGILQFNMSVAGVTSSSGSTNDEDLLVNIDISGTGQAARRIKLYH